ncbi:MAG: hypothetical protein IKA36_02540 [Clostridia bacterium]|nr:hypothetical protein [Clostridia bacterium]
MRNINENMKAVYVDVIDKLIEKTRTGNIKWENHCGIKDFPVIYKYRSGAYWYFVKKTTPTPNATQTDYIIYIRTSDNVIIVDKLQTSGSDSEMLYELSDNDLNINDSGIIKKLFDTIKESFILPEDFAKAVAEVMGDDYLVEGFTK